MGSGDSALTLLTSMKLNRRTIIPFQVLPTSRGDMGHELLSFMYAYSDYNQIKMHPSDEDKIAFTTSQGIYAAR